MTPDEVEHAVEVGRRIAQLRKEFEGKGMKQKELGDLLGVTERSIAAYEAGDVIPYRYMHDLESIFQKPAAWILHGEERRDEQLLEILDEIKALRQEVRRALKK